MNCSAAIPGQSRREDPDRLLQAALSQADRLAEMAFELEALRAQNASWSLPQPRPVTIEFAQPLNPRDPRAAEQRSGPAQRNRPRGRAAKSSTTAH